MEDVYSSGSILYNVPLYMVKRIVPLLRPEDIKIACTKLIQAQIPKGVDLNSANGRMYRNSLQKISRAYSVLNSYVELRLHEQKAKRIKEVNLSKTVAPGSALSIVSRDAFLKDMIRPEREKNGIYYEGNIVPTKLRFGNFLYYSGLISYQMLDDALEWQKRKRPLMGQIAMERGIVIPSHFAETLFHLQNAESFGQVARNLNIMTDANIVDITNEQKKYNCQIGQFFIEKEILDRSDIERLMEQFLEHNYRYSDRE
jgi:hypothetical protein